MYGGHVFPCQSWSTTVLHNRMGLLLLCVNRCVDPGVTTVLENRGNIYSSFRKQTKLTGSQLLEFFGSSHYVLCIQWNSQVNGKTLGFNYISCTIQMYIVMNYLYCRSNPLPHIFPRHYSTWADFFIINCSSMLL